MHHLLLSQSHTELTVPHEPQILEGSPYMEFSKTLSEYRVSMLNLRLSKQGALTRKLSI